MSRTRRTHSTEFKAQALADLAAEGATVKAVAEKNGIQETLLRRWMSLAGVAPPNGSRPRRAAPRKGSRGKPSQFQKDILQMLADLPAGSIVKIAESNGVTVRQINGWARRFGMPQPRAKAEAVAVGNGAAANPFLLLQTARESLSAMIAQIDAMQSAFTTFRQIFGGKSAHG